MEVLAYTWLMISKKYNSKDHNQVQNYYNKAVQAKPLYLATKKTHSNKGVKLLCNRTGIKQTQILGINNSN